VPKAISNNNFDIDHHYLFRGATPQKNVLYLLKPLCLASHKKIESSMGIIQVYQDFDTFQHTAATLMTKEGYLGSQFRNY
jgi:hypothetical protein